MASTVWTLVRVSKALADETRIRMLKLLLEKDICVCEMEEIFPISHSQVSRDLKALMDAGFLKRWHDGKCVVYVADRVNSNKYCRALLDVLADSYNDNEEVKRDRERLQQVIAAQVREKKK
jgi:ArsR family transcriptional regulator